MSFLCLFSHKWSETQSNSQKCRSERVCLRCGEVEAWDNHNWKTIEEIEEITGYSGTYHCSGPCCDAGAGGEHRDAYVTITRQRECNKCGKKDVHIDQSKREEMGNMGSW